MVLLLVFMQLTRDLFAIAKFLLLLGTWAQWRSSLQNSNTATSSQPALAHELYSLSRCFDATVMQTLAIMERCSLLSTSFRCWPTDWCYCLKTGSSTHIHVITIQLISVVSLDSSRKQLTSDVSHDRWRQFCDAKVLDSLRRWQIQSKMASRVRSASHGT